MKPPTADGQPAGAPPVGCVEAGAAPPVACVVVCVVVVVVVAGAVVVCTVVVAVVAAVVIGVLACVVTGGGVSVAPLSLEPLEPQAPTASATSRPSGSARTRGSIWMMLASGVGGTPRGGQPEPVASPTRLRYARVPGASQWVGRSFELRFPVERRQGGANDTMSVKYAVLGLLAQRRGYGYDLVQRFEEQVGPAWQLNAGAIYVALDKLEQEGLVKPLVAGDGADQPVRRRTARGAPRVIYEATPQGLERFEDWMATGSSMAPLREELHLKLALSQPRNLARLIELTYEQEEACLERLEQHRGGTAFDDLLASAQPWPAVASVMVRDAEVAHLQATVHWLRSIREAMRWLQERPEALRSRG